jgi:predicted membrane-bound spermidine synthase
MSRLFLAFFGSGFAALLCQVAWQRMLGVFAGSDAVAAALVVGAFLSGLGLGSIFGAMIADRLSPARAVLAFALAEGGIGAFALWSKLFLYDWVAMDLAGSVGTPFALFAVCFVGLLLPTTLMGASLPLLSRAVSNSVDGLAERIGWLNGLNTLGAGLGALLGGWFVIGNLGVVDALRLAAAVNLLAGLLALSVLPHASTASPPPRGARAVRGIAAHGGLPIWCLLVFFSGFIVVALEIVWVRLMGQVGQYHAYLFPTVLGIFLLADGLGTAVGVRLLRRIGDPRPAFFVAQGGGFVLSLTLIMLLWFVLPHEPLASVLSIEGNRLSPAALLAMAGLATALIGPPAFVLGLTFAFVQKAVQRDVASVGTRVGWVQCANIVGNAGGSLVTGLVALHWLGTAGTLKLLAALTLLMLVIWLGRARRLRFPEIGFAAACGLGLLLLPDTPAFWSRLHGVREGQTAIVAEDRSGVVVFRAERDEGPEGRGHFFIQGFSQARLPFLDIHQFLGAVGPLLHPSPQRILVIGAGSGGTPWASGIRPESDVRAVEIVEPVLSVLQQVAARYPDSPVARMQADPRWTFEYGDGRRLLARESRTYDVIEADAVLPEASQSGLLYSAEFLEQVRQRLAPGGLYVQWAPTRRTVDTFVAVFPHAVLLLPASVLVGSNDPIDFDPERLRAAFRDPAHLAHLQAGTPGVEDWSVLFADQAVRWSPERPRRDAPLTDLFPRDEFFLNGP